MRFDLVLLPTYVDGRDPAFDVYYRQILEQIELAEELGFTCCWFTEHHLAPYGGPVPNPAAMIMAAAARTARIRFGCSVCVLPLRHPLHVAEDYAMADAMSGGRIEFGVGVGNSPREYGAFGVEREDGRARFEEALTIVLGLWASDRFSYSGRFWTLEDASLYPRPSQRPHPPVWIAGSSEASLGRAGRLGYNIMTVAHPYEPEQVRPGVAVWRSQLIEGGRDPAQHHCLIHLRAFVGDSAPEAVSLGQAAIDRYNQLSRQGLGRGARPSESDWEGMLAAGRNVYGDPTQCVELMRRTRQNYDFDVFGMQFNFGGLSHDEVVKSMRLFGKHVMPAFAG
jgi:alkanesulfonate monooxygenase SsuD/methylene tetrahydromethanopterin reductase-like flavin-dependent oxidoreductase (luciferase family)